MLSVEQQRCAWREEARSQRCCQHPDCERPTAPGFGHHVVYEQEVLRRGFPKYDIRNCLRLCQRCHFNHHYGPPEKRLPLSALRPSNVTYAREVLGDDFYIDYLTRRYAT